MNARLTFVHALTPLHAGIGQGVGVIDLPIAREKATGLPFLPGSSLKGALRSRCTAKECIQVFGPETTDIDPDSNYASSIQFSDQRLLLLPIRSLAGTFAWVTSPYVLHRFVRDAEDAQIHTLASLIPAVQDLKQCYSTGTTSKITMDLHPNIVYLEDLDLEIVNDSDITKLAIQLGQLIFSTEPIWQQMLIERICMVHNDVFNFLVNTATEITARIKLMENSKTVKDGGLWYEEALPTESILSGLALATPVKAANITSEQVFKVITDITKNTIQLGGKATVGRGMCRLQMVQGEV